MYVSATDRFIDHCLQTWTTKMILLHNLTSQEDRNLLDWCFGLNWIRRLFKMSASSMDDLILNKLPPLDCPSVGCPEKWNSLFWSNFYSFWKTYSLFGVIFTCFGSNFYSLEWFLHFSMNFSLSRLTIVLFLQ